MPNYLAGETSPYLLQHAENPVDWYPWGKEALAIAQTQNKPILLSIGYSACHWCHVMAHESFEDAEVAAVMNAHFVNIKVDREERPDIDQIYQSAHYALNHRSGGWPLTMFLTPAQTPFFGGTYFPKEARYGMPGFLELLPKVAAAYHTRAADIEQQNTALLKLLAQSLPTSGTDTSVLSRQLIEHAQEQLNRQFDEVYGGFGDAPKFLHPAELQFCLQRYVADNDTRALHILTHTLEKMAQGGLYDQLGGGFCRYSTDRFWRIPHFEKMLYDNALLLPLYAEAWLITDNPLFKRIVEETAAWVMREMHAGTPEGGYYSSLDADSEHEEGKFYVWDRQAVAAILTVEEYQVTAAYYGLDRPPNFEDRYWHLEVTQSIEAVAARNHISQETAQQRIESARRKLLNEREQRIRPGRDEKILTSWNALMIKGMARAGQIFEREEWISSAMQAMDFIRHTLWREGRLLATCKDGKAHLNAYLDDHAFLLDSLLTLLQIDFRQTDLDFAITLADVLLTCFEDEASGGFFFTSHDHEMLIHRPKTGYDGAIPAGNGIAAIALQRLGYLLNEPRYLESAKRTLDVFSDALSHQAGSHCSMLIALEEFLEPTKTVVLHGNNRSELQTWLKALVPCSLDMVAVALSPELSGLPDGLKGRSVPDGKISVRVCEGRRCLPEIHSLDELLQICRVHGRMHSLNRS
ncbi:thioredoxin domain-containing protein [Nitrosomonas sp. HPC101]|uniref:thioredoxin domain-containing protein n=1 Tax=Nitrosomonas sp. HPC101 TaxID=1658667 RepID=UPI00136C49A9|nr:thioredoxin domain-containing protein [Nitrosomonas sp. HPC101]MXS85638.1 thioredoxin domain-containing protein [Nitrosomonas sp. HPC101]